MRTFFETSADLENARHLILHQPAPCSRSRPCRVILFFDESDLPEQAEAHGIGSPAAWPENFFEEITVDDVTFVRPEQGDYPPIQALNT